MVEGGGGACVGGWRIVKGGETAGRSWSELACLLPKLFHVITEFCRFNCFSFVNYSYRYQIAVGPMCVTILQIITIRSKARVSR